MVPLRWFRRAGQCGRTAQAASFCIGAVRHAAHHEEPEAKQHQERSCVCDYPKPLRRGIPNLDIDHLPLKCLKDIPVIRRNHCVRLAAVLQAVIDLINAGVSGYDSGFIHLARLDLLQKLRVTRLRRIRSVPHNQPKQRCDADQHCVKYETLRFGTHRGYSFLDRRSCNPAATKTMTRTILTIHGLTPVNAWMIASTVMTPTM